MDFYAKSDPEETIREHTEELLKRYEQLKKQYGDRLPLTERDWYLLKIMVLYHDVGKADAFFQNKIRSALEKPLLQVASAFDVQHNYLSILAVPVKQLGLDKEEEKLVMQAIAYHHERDRPVHVVEALANYRENILPIRDKLKAHMGFEIEERIKQKRFDRISTSQRFTPSHGPIFRRYVLLKGLLHRLDHAASAHVPIELSHDLAVGDYVNRFMEREFNGAKKELQQFTEANQDKHVVVVAQTGMGKTEAGLLWLGREKGFFTLPLRVSLNAMYDRIVNPDKIGFTHVTDEHGETATGLLHSTSLDYLLDTIEGDDAMLEKVHAQSKEFANKLVISTIDQVLKFPFFYLGFEKEYATMASSKLIIDELQAYNPKIAALLVRAMAMIDEIGGSFLIMTATLPDFYYKALQRELKQPNKSICYGEFIDDQVKRHNVSIREKSILDCAKEAAEAGKTKKVLMICNTVDQARELYKEVVRQLHKEVVLHHPNTEQQIEGQQNWTEIHKEVVQHYPNIHLLHSRFIQKDRKRLESKIMEFAKSEETGIWVTTQLVEASLDIDFDVLYSEMASLDSLFQRLGRCNRRGEKTIDVTNVHILTKDVSGVGSVYDQDIYQRSLDLLSEQSGVLMETKKHAMIQRLYDEEALVGTAFKAEFDETLKQLKFRPLYEIGKQKAQSLLRDFQQNQVVPTMFLDLDEVQQAINNWENANKQFERKADIKRAKRKARRTIEKYSVSVNKFKNLGLSDFYGIKGLHIAECRYDATLGLLTDEIEGFFS
ncbi:CRISPR-associated helicase Cas3' [Halalkalibacterium halodurans]|uniref:CRISPR-associated helicase Cas3' n=1 Tax=Halalkalibacterium halodurans TaxID=86665 RepID=UPI002E1C2643|nr:CRISPR-associated helicase Cas3' [Halalkalibacterium halodurans]MED3648442.1 CRISPR-associated helicase Cas3' [Halalkalibacterium halodurans]